MTASTAPQPASPHLSPAPRPFSLISPERLWDLYAAMLRCRAIAERAGSLVQSGLPAHTLRDALGREATYAGVLVGLQSADVFFPAPEDTLAGFLHGLTLGNLFAPLARPAPARRKKSAPMSSTTPGPLPLAPSPSEQLSLANGAAFALKPHTANPLVVALCGPGAAPQQAWQQALQFAAAHTLPILFVCHAQPLDNASLAETEAHFNQLSTLAQTARVPAIAVDAHDVVAVHRVASESISRARLRRGPTLIACHAHPTSQVSGQVQDRKSDADHTAEPLAGSGDAIRTMENYLGRKALFDPARKSQLLDGFARQLDHATRGLLR